MLWFSNPSSNHHAVRTSLFPPLCLVMPFMRIDSLAFKAKLDKINLDMITKPVESRFTAPVVS